VLDGVEFNAMLLIKKACYNITLHFIRYCISRSFFGKLDVAVNTRCLLAPFADMFFQYDLEFRGGCCATALSL